MDLENVIKAAKWVKKEGSARFCMVVCAAWHGSHDKDLEHVCDMVREVKKS